MENTSAVVRGFGGLLLGIAGALFAQRLGMPTWQTVAVLFLVTLGSALVVTGRMTGW